MSNEHLEISRVTIDFPTDKGAFRALEDVSLKIARGEFVSLIGHSGCGKSTVLNIVAGLHQATSGGVILDGREVNEPGPDRAVVFQNHSLLPWLTAYENVELAVKQVFRGRKTRREMDEWIRHNLALVHMDHALHKRPDEISGGMKQRVGIARALAMEPKVLLLDEPFGALDALTRTHMQDSLMEIHQALGNTVIMITHDVDEAVLLSDRIVMMTNGPAATVGDILAVDLPRPRQRLELAEDPAYNHYRAEVVRFLHEGHQRPKQKPAAGASLEKAQLKIGFMPLTDCAPLVVAREKGFFAEQGLDVTLVRESSWANIRDKVSYGLLDGAQMLAGIPLAASLPRRDTPMVAAMSLDLNGNAITVSRELYARMQATGEDLHDAMGSARALRKVIDIDQKCEVEPLIFAVVFPESSHNYLLRYWMASAGIDPDRDVLLLVVPPPQMVSHLKQGLISGFCVGEPWNALAVEEGRGHTLISTHAIWNNHPEKVYGATRAWAEQHPRSLQALVTALMQACAWIDDAGNRDELCTLLGQSRYVDCPAEVLRLSLSGAFPFGDSDPAHAHPDFNVFHRYAANHPWRSHALWTLAQMRRWGQLDDSVDLEQIAREVYRPEWVRQAGQVLGCPMPDQEYKREGEHAASWTLPGEGGSITMGADAFMDGRLFDPGDVEAYLQGFDGLYEEKPTDQPVVMECVK